MESTIQKLESKESEMESTIRNQNQIVEDMKTTVSHLKSENAALKADIETLKTSNSELISKEAKIEKTVNNMKTSLDSTKTKTLSINNDIDNLKSNEKRLDREISDLSKKIDNQVSKSVPINTVYIQYPFELEPSKIWKCGESGIWRDISSTYADLFFRVNGPKSSFGAVQQENAPRLDKVTFTSCNVDESTCKAGDDSASFVPVDGWSNRVFVSWYYEVKATMCFFNFYHNSGGEVRPRNMAVKVWKCVE